MRPLAGLAHQATRIVAKKRGGAMASLQLDWAMAVGPDVADWTRPLGLRGGVLTIAVDGARALTLQHAEPALIDRVNAYFGGRTVSRIAWRQTRLGPAASTPRAAAPPPSVAAPPSPTHAALAEIEDERLRVALTGLRDAITRA